MRIGIPRSLYAYYYYPLWRAFLEELGAQTVLSPPTGKKILDAGVAACIDGACLPVKLFFGHALLLDGAVDRLFIPCIMSMAKKEYSCPYVCGLPEMMRHSLPLKTPVLTLRMDFYRGPKGFYRHAEQFGLLFTKDRARIRRAFVAGITAFEEHCRMMHAGMHAGHLLSGAWHSLRAGGRAIGIVAHPYVLYDAFTGKALEFVRQNGFSVLTPEMLPQDRIEAYASALPKKMFWSAGKHLYGSAGAMCDADVAGILYLSTFGCGIDSIIDDLAERLVRKKGVPFLLLNIDEHTGEAGVRTRVEAFADMVARRRSDGLDVPAYGQHLHTAQSDL